MASACPQRERDRSAYLLESRSVVVCARHSGGDESSGKSSLFRVLFNRAVRARESSDEEGRRVLQSNGNNTSPCSPRNGSEISNISCHVIRS